MKSKLLTISEAAEMIGVSIQTLRRWDGSGKLPSIREKEGRHRYYKKNDIYDFIRNSSKNLFGLGKNWAASKQENELPSVFYCPDISVFQARLSRLEKDLGKVRRLNKIFPLISAITGEIGNNSFDHNLGNWPDMLGIFFAYDLSKGYIVLADRGQGVLVTLKKVKPELSTHRDALRIAFTEIVSGRAPEYRGNGLKFVKNVIMSNKMSLFFQTGDARLELQKGKFNLKSKGSKIYLQGCLASIKF